MKKNLLAFFSVIFFLAPSALFAEGTFGKGQPIEAKSVVRKAVVRVRLTPEEIERVRAFKQLTAEVDKKTIEQTVEELETADNSALELQKHEAIAKAYAEVVVEKKVTDLKQKEWLYSMVAINMAYLQFGAQVDDSGNALNRLIRRKIRENLPPEALNHPGFRFEVKGTLP